MSDMVVYIQTLIGMVPDMKGTHTFKVNSIRTYYTREQVTAATTGHDMDQVVRAFLLYLLGTTLFVDTTSSLDLVFLIPLRDLDLIATYDWGSYALAYLYKSMDETMRRVRLRSLTCYIGTFFLSFSFILLSFKIHYDYC